AGAVRARAGAGTHLLELARHARDERLGDHERLALDHEPGRAQGLEQLIALELRVHGMIEQRAEGPRQDEILEQILEVKAPARFEHAADLGHRLAPGRHMMQNSEVEDGVEAGVGKIQARGVADPELGAVIEKGSGVRTRALDLRRIEGDRHHTLGAEALQDQTRTRAPSTADLERPATRERAALAQKQRYLDHTLHKRPQAAIDGQGLQAVHDRHRVPFGTTAMASISTSAPLGRPATWMVARAGGAF